MSLEQRKKDIKKTRDLYFYGTSELHGEYSHAYAVNEIIKCIIKWRSNI